MKVTFVNQTFYPDVVATAQHLSDIAFYFSRKGHEVSVITWRRGYAEPHPLYPSHEMIQGVKVFRVWPFAFGRTNRFFRILDSLFLNIAFFLKLLFLPRADCIVALTSPPLIGFFALVCARLKGARFVYWVMDLNPDEAVEMGWLKKNSLIAMVLEFGLCIILENSQTIIALDDQMKKRLILKGADSKKIVVIPPWSHDELETVAHSKNPFRESMGLKDKFVIMYSGNHSVCHPLDTLLEAAYKMKEEPDIVFIFIGGGARIKDVMSFKDNHGLENVWILPYQERSMLKNSLSAGDIHIVSMGERMPGIVHPCKVYGILKIGRPYICIGPEESFISEIIRESGVGTQVNHGDVKGLVEAVWKIKGFQESQLRQVQEKEQAYAQKFSAEVLSKKLHEVLTRDHV